MNRFFGKRLQKLAIAGFVACAALAPVFQIKAVQDFIVNDMARLIMERPLNNPDAWRRALSALSGAILVVSAAIFGFLYCVATSARLSGYFKGAGDELKSFFHNKDIFSRRNGRILLAIFAAAFIGYFALLRGGAGYLDDIARSIGGHFGWMFGFTRVVTEVLNLAIHGAYLIHDRSPLGQIIAMGFLSVAALVMALAFSGLSARREDRRLKWRNVAAAMILVFNPYFLDGIAFKYDSPGMGISILFPLLPFLFICAPRLYTVSSFFCVLGVYMSYQASSGIYIMMVIFAALLKFLKEEWTLSDAAKFCAKSAAVFVAASALFLLASCFLGVSFQYRTTNVSAASALQNIATYFADIWRDFNGLWKALSLLVAVAAAFAACRLSRKKMAATLPLVILALLLALVLSQGGYIFLEDYYDEARGKYSFGALLAMLASISVLNVPSLGASWKKALAAAPAVLLAWSFFTYASAFGNAHANQMKMLNQYTDLVRKDINELFAYDDAHKISIAFIGAPPWSGEVSNLVKKYPITASLVTRRTWDLSFFLSYFDSTIGKATATSAGKPIGKTTLLISRRYYNILIEEGTGMVIVECRMEES